jgi:hypothetical protein
MVTLETIVRLMTAAQAEGSARDEHGIALAARTVFAVVAPFDAAFSDLEARVDALQAKVVEHDQTLTAPPPPDPPPNPDSPFEPETIAEPAPHEEHSE